VSDDLIEMMERFRRAMERLAGVVRKFAAAAKRAVERLLPELRRLAREARRRARERRPAETGVRQRAADRVVSCRAGGAERGGGVRRRVRMEPRAGVCRGRAA
jgi:hypothetical protein